MIAKKTKYKKKKPEAKKIKVSPTEPKKAIINNKLPSTEQNTVIIPKKKGGAPLGNQFWKLRSKHGRDKLFATPKLLWKAACEYFEWCENNPLYETKAFAFQGVITTEILPKMRAMTLSQLCFYLKCNEAYFRTFKAQLPDGEKDFNTVINEIESTIYNQKFQGASADLLNANIISRDLGLIDKTDSKHSGEVFIKTLADIAYEASKKNE